MIVFIRYFLVVALCLVLQVTVFPCFLADGYQPNLLLIVVSFLGLRSRSPLTFLAVLMIGLAHDSLSGVYFGLRAFVYLCLYFVLSHTASQLYTDRRSLMIIVVVCGTVGAALMNLVLLALFTAADGVYVSILPALLPQGLVNALVASIVFSYPGLYLREESA